MSTIFCDYTKEIIIDLVEVKMGSQQQQLEIVRGAKLDFVFQLTTEEDISNVSEIIFTTKISPSDPDSNIVLQKEFNLSASDLKKGKFVFSFVPEDTKRLDSRSYWYDVQMVFDTYEVYQIAIGNFTITRNVFYRY